MIQRLFAIVLLLCCVAVARAEAQTEPAKDSPKETLLAQDAAARAGNVDADLAVYQADDDQQKKLAHAIAQGDVAIAKLETAVEKKFGKELAAQVVRAAGSEAVAAVKNSSEEVNGDHATVKFLDSGSSVPMVRADGKWKISLSDWVRDAKPARVDQLITAVGKLATGIDQITQLVEQDKFRSGEGVRDRVQRLHDQTFSDQS
jgi:hypothetical protein